MSEKIESYLEIELDQQPIELCKLLKIADLVTGGGEAKVVISEGYVVLNGEVEYQKRKKVYHNDIIEFNGETIQVVINESLTESDGEDEGDIETVLSSKQASPSRGNTVQEPPIQVAHAPELSKKSSSKQPKRANTSSTTNKSQKKAAPTNVDTASRNKRKPISF